MPCLRKPLGWPAVGGPVYSQVMRVATVFVFLYSLTSQVYSQDFETATPESQGIPSHTLREMSEWIRSEELDVRSMIVLRNGKLVMEWYAGEVDREMNHNTFSVTKSMVATLAGIALSEREIRSADATLNDLLGFEGGPGEVTFEDLLTMRSGLPQSRANKATGVERELFDRINDAPDRLTEIQNLKLAHPPGEVFAYSNIDPQLVSAALEKAYGKKLIEIAREKLFRHLRFNGARWVYADQTGSVPGGYGLRLRPIDMAKLGQLYLQGGVWEGKQILPTEWVVRAVSDITGENYGYFWWTDIARDGGKSFAAKGVRGQQILVVPEKKIVFVMTSDLPPERVGEVLKTLNFAHLLPSVVDRPLPADPSAEDDLTAELKKASEYVPEHRKGLIPARLPRFPNDGPSPSPEPGFTEAGQALAAAKDTTTPTVLIAAHRGGYANDKADDAPENSVANVEVAISKGYDVYETDIRRTADGAFVVVHDDTLDRETNGSGPVENLTINEVKSLKKRYRDGTISEHKVALFKDLLTAGKGRLLFKADLKPGVINHFDDLASLVTELDMQDHIFFRTSTKDADAIAKALAAGAPKVEVMYKVDRSEQVQKIADLFSPTTIQVNIAKGESLSEEKKEAIRKAVDLGILVESHSYGDPEQWQQLAEAGVRMFHTANPDETLKYLRENGWRAGGKRMPEKPTSEFLAINDTFVDWARTSGIERRINPPGDIRRVLKPEMPWEALGLIFYCTVIDYEGTAMLYYGCYDKGKKKHLCLATSKDGIQWSRPELGLTDYGGSKENNLFPQEAVEAGVFIDPSVPEEKRFRMLHNRNWPDPETAGVYLSSSPDGINWKQHETRLFPFVPDSQPSAFWDKKNECYAIYLRAWDPKRSIARVAVPNIETPWPFDESVEPLHVWGEEKVPTPSRELPIVMRPDERDPENVHLYTSTAFRYPWANRTYLAFPAAYFHYKGDRWKDRALDGNDGTFDVQLAVSSDGVTWKRFREPWIEPDLIDGLQLQLVSMGQGMIRRGNLLHQYFVGWPYTHNQPVEWDRKPEIRDGWSKKDLGGIYCATNRLDRFVSLSAGPEGGTLTTEPVTLVGNSISLNVDTSGTGFATMALLDVSGSPLDGFDHSDCVAIHTDSLDHFVTWKSDRPELGESPVRIQLKLQNARVFAIRIGK
ncbi:MAG: hypothetical protein CMO55_19375 [Verrucomicrobiales bacterium]|nr:hypothetical protein [Verrucomicrobiales bacterium]